MPDKKKKILFCITSLRGGGAEKVLIDILEHLDYSKYEVVLCLYFKTGVYLDQVPENVAISSIMPSNNLLMRLCNKLFFGMPQKKLLPRIITDWYISKRVPEKYDFEVAFTHRLPCLIIGLNTSKAKKIAWIHGDMYKNQFTAPWFINQKEQQQIFERFQNLIFVSNDTKKAFEKLFSNNEVDKQVIYNLIPKNKILELSNKQVKTNKKFTFCTVARFEEEKKIDRLITAASILAKKGISNFKVQIIGTGGLEKKLVDLTKKLEIKKHVEFLGFQKNPYPLINNSDCYVNTSLSEGYPLTICEALTLSKPIIATNTTGNNEVLGYGKYGTLVGHTPEEICEAMYKVFTDVQFRTELKEKARKGAENFKEEQVMNQIYTILK